jgi:hypothetical protein
MAATSAPVDPTSVDFFVQLQRFLTLHYGDSKANKVMDVFRQRYASSGLAHMFTAVRVADLD